MSVTEKFTTEWWENLSEEEEFSASVKKIEYILQFAGKWNKGTKVLELQCGLGSMPLFMNDNGFRGYRGTDNSETVVGLWEDSESLHLLEPDHTGFADNAFDLVCWFSMGDGRIEQDRVTDVLNEMDRIGNGAIIVKPFEQITPGCDTAFLAYMMNNGWMCSDANARHKMFLFHKG